MKSIVSPGGEMDNSPALAGLFWVGTGCEIMTC